MSKPMQVAIIGGGIVGLAMAMNLRKRGIGVTVYEAAPAVKELGVGITVLPHAMRELAALGLQERVEATGILNAESCFFNRFGQLIYREPRGRSAGYPYPEVGIHRGRLHRVLWDAAVEQLGAGALRVNWRCTGFSQDGAQATAHFDETTTGRRLPDVQADLVIACDGVNSVARRQMYPGEDVVFTNINTWRGVTRHKPIMGGRTYIRIGSIKRAKIVIYPIVDDIDGEGNQLINWTTEITSDTAEKNDWNKAGRLEDFMPMYQDWTFDWLDVAGMLRRSDVVFEYPMVDKNPISRWSEGRVVLAGDAAHPMYPRGSNGSAQGLIDARALADQLARHATDWQAAIRAYEAERVAPAARVVETNRSNPPDFINIKVEELTNDQPFTNLDDFISQDELRALSDQYKRIAGFNVTDVV
jgi:2-polyprenyl-6-methoxyphenol hydroxylase-like FAD-dependent oxidoreductase